MHYRGVKVELCSQFDVQSLPEYCPRLCTYYTRRGASREQANAVPKLFDERSHASSVYVPVYPSSQFWLSYSVAPPLPDTALFLFKLYINGTHIVSWSAGLDEQWQGKTMFALYEAEMGVDEKKRIEKRALCFTSCEKDRERDDVMDPFDPDAYLEVRVHRAKGRKRLVRRFEHFEKTPHGIHGRGIELVNAGRAGSEQPKRLYKFALIDPVDQPYATFRFYYRTWDQLKELGLFEEEEEGIDDLDAVEEDHSADDTCAEHPELAGKAFNGTGIREGSDQENAAEQLSGAYSMASAQSDRCLNTPQSQHKSSLATPRRLYRLSVPPSIRLSPAKPSSKLLPTIPQKTELYSSTAYRPHPAYSMEDWMVRTPSPEKSLRDGMTSPPLRKSRINLAGSLMNVITNTFKKQADPSSAHADSITSGAAS